jgi:hypothetical protein
MPTEIETARAHLRALQKAARNRAEDIALIRKAIAEHEAAVHAATQELGDLAKGEAAASKDRLERMKAGGDVAKAAGREQREALERQNDLRGDIEATQIVLETLRAELAAEEAKAADNDAIAFAAEKVLTAQLEEIAQSINEQIRQARERWTEISAAVNKATVPEWRQLYGYPQPVKASRGLKYGHQVELLMAERIGEGAFSRANFDALGSKWSEHFQRLQSDADAAMPELGASA